MKSWSKEIRDIVSDCGACRFFSLFFPSRQTSNRRRFGLVQRNKRTLQRPEIPASAAALPVGQVGASAPERPNMNTTMLVGMMLKPVVFVDDLDSKMYAHQRLMLRGRTSMV